MAGWLRVAGVSMLSHVSATTWVNAWNIYTIMCSSSTSLWYNKSSGVKVLYTQASFNIQDIRVEREGECPTPYGAVQTRC